MGRITDHVELERLIRDAILGCPERVNPRATDGSCLWRDPYEELYCVLASVLVEKLGFRYEVDWEGREPFRLFLDLGFDIDAALVAYRWQDDPRVARVAWRDVLDRNTTSALAAA